MTDDSDPFGPFRKVFDQFDTSGSGPGSGLGWPLSPVPIPGAGTSGTLSPEGSTKQAVKRLYSALEALSQGESIASASDAWSQYLEAFDLDTSAFGPEELTAATLRTYRIWFFSLTQLLVESYTLRLVQDELVVEEHQRSTRTQEWLWGLPQSDREQLLKRCTDVPDDLTEEMETLRRRRDELLYTFGGWEEVEFEESVDDARRSLEVLTALDDRVTEGAPFSYFPGGGAASDPDDAVADIDDSAPAVEDDSEQTSDDASEEDAVDDSEN